MKNYKTNVHNSLFSLRKYLFFFVMIAFVITCSLLLFLNGLNIEELNITKSAFSTFLNILILSLIFTLIHNTYYRFLVEKPVQQILDATHRITNGDFKVRIEPINTFGKTNELDIIINNFNEMAEELSGIETLRNDFISNVSHELKTPLSIIQNYAALMQNEKTTDLERKEYSKSVYETSQNLSKLITNILKLNKLENQKIFLETYEYNLSNQLTECLLCFESIWEEKNINIEVDIDEHIMLNADEELTSIIWNNLYSNAFKFTPKNGTVSIKAKKYENLITVSVSDTGCGMSSETGKHIFEKFYQGDTSHATKGNGLGLALVKKIIDIINAQIYIESELGKGTTFTVKLDIQENKTKNI
ncbi:HAMP domain-containing histidine kinase [Intestinibacter bartlettii]|uniref:histidine kinase n=2 Tax=Intestinibacter bartlettii TaxID=261299 RepID=A0ABS6DW33_9FIRM|nr:HAMP domain-containing histidine kinase [Intestinibacter bartlettii]